MLTTARSTLRTRIQSARSFPNSANQEVRTKIFIFLVRRHHRSSPRVWQKPTDQRCIDCATHDHFGAHIGVIRRNGVPGNQGSIWMSVPHRAKCRRSQLSRSGSALAVAFIIAKVLEQMVHPVTVSYTQSATWRRAGPSDGRPPARRSGSNMPTARRGSATAPLAPAGLCGRVVQAVIAALCSA
jgi:hypothetical protein